MRALRDHLLIFFLAVITSGCVGRGFFLRSLNPVAASGYETRQSAVVDFDALVAALPQFGGKLEVPEGTTITWREDALCREYVIGNLSIVRYPHNWTVQTLNVYFLAGRVKESQPISAISCFLERNGVMDNPNVSFADSNAMRTIGLRLEGFAMGMTKQEIRDVYTQRVAQIYANDQRQRDEHGSYARYLGRRLWLEAPNYHVVGIYNGDQLAEMELLPKDSDALEYHLMSGTNWPALASGVFRAPGVVSK